jgi:hypothetical protein
VNETVVLGIQMTTVPQRSGNGWGILFRYHGTCSGQPRMNPNAIGQSQENSLAVAWQIEIAPQMVVSATPAHWGGALD